MKIEFLGTLEGAACIKFDGDGSGTVKISIPASELPHVARLLAYREQLLAITIHPKKE